MTYTEIKSEFIKSELKKTKWENRAYIDDLMRIERYARGEHFGWPTGYIIDGLKSKYPKQWKAIWLEVNPKQYKKNIEYKKKEKERERKEEERMKREEALELKRDKQAWEKIRGS